MNDNFSTFVMSETTLKQIKVLPPETQLKFFWAVADYGIDGIEPEFTGLELAVWIPMRDLISHTKKKDEQWREKQKENGKKGGRPKTQNNPENPNAIWVNSETHNDNDNENSGGFEKPPVPDSDFSDVEKPLEKRESDPPEKTDPDPPSRNFDSQKPFREKPEKPPDKNSQPQKKPPLRGREPENDYERVEKAYLRNWDSLFAAGKVETPDPVANWNQIRALLKKHFEKLKPETVIGALDKGLNDGWVMQGGYSLATILSAGVLNRLINARAQGPPPEKKQKEKCLWNEEVGMNITTGAKTVKRACEKHGEYSGEAFSYALPGSPAREIGPACPRCEKEREAEEKRVSQEREKRENARRLRARLKAMNIDEKFWDAGFDNFDACNDELKRHLETCAAFAEKPEGKLVMLGAHGNGKTHLAVAALKKTGGAIYAAFEIGLLLRHSFSVGAISGGRSEWDIFNELCTAPLLVIDEVEKIKDSEHKQNWMSYVIGKRYNRMLPLIIIANCHAQKNCAEKENPCPKCLEYHLENDVISRIVEDGVVLNFTGGDYRRKIRADKLRMDGQ